MKNFRYSMGFKIPAVILYGISCCIACFTGIVAVILENYSAFSASGIDPTALLSTVNDRYIRALINFVVANPGYTVAAAALSAVLAATLFCCLVAFAGRGRDGQLKNSLLTKFPYELILLAIVGAAAPLYLAFASFLSYSNLIGIVLFAGSVLLISLLLLFAAVNLSHRIKLGGWWKHTFIYGLLFLLVKAAKLVRYIPASIGVSAAALGFLFVNFVITAGVNGGSSFAALLLIAVDLAAITAVSYYCFELRRLKKLAADIAAGNAVEGHSGRRLTPWLASFDRSLRNISGGVSLAVEKQMKSERLRTELITNVSHDIKTPLTSIITYTDLLKETELDAKGREYAAVLDRQSARLKKLINDLVDASKAATGNIEPELKPTDINELVRQTLGEYSEALSGAGLIPVTDMPEHEIYALADGRLTWRIFDNLLSNAVRYSQPDTRVYISAAASDGQITISFKNISKEPLNIPPDELTERFVRGDASRSTGGSGLGLNIAKSLAEVQHGNLELEIDGDLFKASLRLPMPV